MNFSEHKVRLEGVAGYYLALSFSIPHPVDRFTDSQKVLGKWDKDWGRQIVTRVAHLISY